MTACPHPVLPDERLAVRDHGRYSLDCEDACPVVPGRRYPDWPVADPDDAPIAVVHSIRDDIDARITDLLDTLPPSS
ncbi:hypothetical protein QFZ82_007483 [Streptomyces sp. V4I23]|uniref:hypothetical protein n=1 Tax=Streptomyces sp. V4I23 TaxID=3042282 RepID=UPI00278894F2|nr:hypothetical protein [Streptomyces sp. V4I23]MDQ1012998.1 hypothetical protein [Streptomyces sp. V4I23]